MYKLYIKRNPLVYGFDSFIENLKTNEITQLDYANWYITESNKLQSCICIDNLVIRPVFHFRKHREVLIWGGVEKNKSVLHHMRITPYYSKKNLRNDDIVYFIVETINIFYYNPFEQHNEFQEKLKEYRLLVEDFNKNVKYKKSEHKVPFDEVTKNNYLVFNNRSNSPK